MTKKKTNREILDAPLYDMNLNDLYENTAAGDKNLVTVEKMFRKILFQYDAPPRNDSADAAEEAASKLTYADELLRKLGETEVVLTESDVNLLKALCMGMPFQAGSVRYQLLQVIEALQATEVKKEIPSKK